MLLTRSCSVNLTDDGKAALLKLSKGDMRRALNVLQACHAAYERIGETEVYTCTGSPHPADIEAIVNSMLTEEFTTSLQSESFLRSQALVDINHTIAVSDHCTED
jgi:replication factor C subunit 3/5